MVIFWYFVTLRCFTVRLWIPSCICVIIAGVKCVFLLFKLFKELTSWEQAKREQYSTFCNGAGCLSNSRAEYILNYSISDIFRLLSWIAVCFHSYQCASKWNNETQPYLICYCFSLCSVIIESLMVRFFNTEANLDWVRNTTVMKVKISLFCGWWSELAFLCLHWHCWLGVRKCIRKLVLNLLRCNQLAWKLKNEC